MTDNNFSSQWVSIAAQLFRQNGYDQTTLAEIAAAAQRPLAELEDTHPHKAQLALAIFRDLAVETQTAAAHLPVGTVSQRFRHLMTGRLRQLQPHEDAISALFASAMRPHGAVVASELSQGQRDPMHQAFAEVVLSAADAPRTPADCAELADMLYTFHWLVLIFWLYDRTAEHRATHLLLDFLGDLFKIVRPMMVMPVFGKAMTKLSQIVMLVFGGAHFTTADSASTPQKLG